MAERAECPTCDGRKIAPCNCSRCSTPEGRAYGVMGHYDRECDDCDDEGMVTECCGLPICECTEQEVAA